MNLTYAEIRDSLKTGDLLLFSGKGTISDLIKHITSAKWSHIGMVVRVPEFEMVLCWESTTLSNVEDVTTGKATRGVQLVALRDRLRTYDGEVCARHLVEPITNGALAALGKFRSEVCGRPYEESKLELLRSAWDGWGGANTEDLSSLFCSELVGEAYQRMGLIDESVPSNEFTPADFRAGAQIDTLLLGKNVLGPEVSIKG